MIRLHCAEMSIEVLAPYSHLVQAMFGALSATLGKLLPPEDMEKLGIRATDDKGTLQLALWLPAGGVATIEIPVGGWRKGTPPEIH